MAIPLRLCPVLAVCDRRPSEPARRLSSTYSVEKLISCALTILQMNHSVAENQA
jgi:hypothetical protein